MPFSYPYFQALDNNGLYLVGGKLYAYSAGTDDLKDTWLDYFATKNSNPIVLNARGEAIIYGSGNYKFKLTDADDVEIWTLDNQAISSPTYHSTSVIVPNGQGDGTADDYTALVAAIAAAKAIGKPREAPAVVDLSGKVWRTTSTLTFNPDYVRIINGCLYGDIADTSAFILETDTSDSPEYIYGNERALPMLENVIFKSANEDVNPPNASACCGLYVKGTSVAGHAGQAVANAMVRNCLFPFLNIAIQLGNKSWSIDFIGCNIMFCNTGIYIPDYSAEDIANGIESGERYSFSAGMIGACGIGILNANYWGNLNCFDMSLDYNTTNMAQITDGGQIRFSNCHIETSPEYYTASNRPFELTNGFMYFMGCNILFAHEDTHSMDYVFSSNEGRVFITDTILSINNTLPNETLSYGTGKVYTSNIQRVYDQTNPVVLSSNVEDNLLLDPGFEQATLSTPGFITLDNPMPTTRTNIGTQLSFDVSATYAKSGSQSLKITKVNGIGDNAQFILYGSLYRKGFPGASMWIKNPGSSLGSITVYLFPGVLASNDIDFVGLNSIGYLEIDLTTTFDWTKFVIPVLDINQIMSNCNDKAILEFDIIAMAGGSIYVDDIIVTAY